eukprot:gene30661-35677_t
MPTRGEGWGMPITEAMSMGLPVIVTNWSGTTAFVDDTVGYLLKYNLSEVPDDQPWWFQGARWADVDRDHLSEVMRHVVNNQAEAKQKGVLARQRMVEKYSPSALGFIIAKESGNCTNCHSTEFVAKPGDQALQLYTGKEEFLKNELVFGGRDFRSIRHGEHLVQISFDHNDVSVWDQVVRQMRSNKLERLERLKRKQETERKGILGKLSSKVLGLLAASKTPPPRHPAVHVISEDG